MIHVDSRGRPAVFVAAIEEAPSDDPRRLGIRSGGGARRLIAAERIAASLGVVVPGIEAAVVGGEVGTLRESVEGGVPLSELRAADPGRADAIEASPGWREDRAAVGVLDHVLGTIARDPSLLLVLSLGRASPHCIPAPTIECLGPLPTSDPISIDAVAAVPWIAARAASLPQDANDLGALLGVEGLLSPEELAQLAERVCAVAAALVVSCAIEGSKR